VLIFLFKTSRSSLCAELLCGSDVIIELTRVIGLKSELKKFML